MKLILILPYFGKLPNYFNLFLKSAAYNLNVDFLLITDDRSIKNYPSNFTIVYKTFDEMKFIFQEKFDFELALDTPFKLCDFKVTYGYILQQYIAAYDYWGYCDPDIIWGNFSNFINEKLLKEYDKLFTLGHLTIYKNTAENNTRFMETISGKLRYKEVFSKPVGFLFDELGNKSINTIFKNKNLPIFTKNFVADIAPYKSNFKILDYDLNSNESKLDKVSKQIFTWEKGNIYRYYISNDKLIKEAFLYIHLQKRNMKFNIEESSFEQFIIRPNEFVSLNEKITKDNFRSLYKDNFFPFQFFRVKFNSLKYKLKYKNHFYGVGKE
jgi:hypothetical protein